MKKIAILYSGSKTGGGVDTYLTNLFRYANDETVSLTLFSLGEWGLTDKFKKENYELCLFDGRRFRLSTIFDISKALKAGGYQLIVSQGVVANAYARAASIHSGIPSLVTIHSDLKGDYQNGFLRTVYLLSDRVLRWRTGRYIAVSEYLRDSLAKTGIKEKKVTVIYNGVEAPKSFPKKKTNKRIMLGSIGRLHPVKNYIGLVSAMHQLSEDGFDLTIWGEGPDRGQLEKLINTHSLELSHNVTLPGWTDDVWESLSGVDIYVQPSFLEGFGLSVVEAQLFGLPVVVTPGGALIELVEDGKTGIITSGFAASDIAAAVLRYYENPKLKADCARGGQASALERFDIQKWANQTLTVYLESIIEK